jgi:hypothetical protein
MRAALPTAIAASLLVLAGCATAPSGQEDDNELLASAAVVKRMALEQASVIEVARFSELHPGGAIEEYWAPYTLQPADPNTKYSVTQVDGRTCVEADADNGHSALQRLMHISPHRNPIIEWSWNVPRLASDGKVSGKPTPRARLMLAFHGDESKIDIEFAVQSLVLAHAHRFPDLTRNLGNIALLKMAAGHALLDPGLADRARDAYREFRRLQHALRLNGAQYARVPHEQVSAHAAAVRELWDRVFVQARPGDRREERPTPRKS